MKLYLTPENKFQNGIMQSNYSILVKFYIWDGIHFFWAVETSQKFACVVHDHFNQISQFKINYLQVFTRGFAGVVFLDYKSMDFFLDQTNLFSGKNVSMAR